jgi:uncharacterized protein Yka (UPF0111/DUF47 family)
LVTKTREIEALVVDEEDQGDSYVEELRNDKRRTLILPAPSRSVQS